MRKFRKKKDAIISKNEKADIVAAFVKSIPKETAQRTFVILKSKGKSNSLQTKLFSRELATTDIEMEKRKVERIKLEKLWKEGMQLTR